MKILIVGGTSSLAQALIPRLAKFSDVLTAGRADCDLTLDLIGLTHELTLPNGLDAVINTASAFGGNGPEAIYRTEEVNVMGMLNLCRACSQSDVGHLVQVSSIFALLDSTSRFFSMYAMSKKHAEDVASLYCATFNLPLTVVRPAQFYGRGPSGRKHQPFLTSMVNKAAAGEDILIYGANDALRNFIHVDDVAASVAAVVEQRLFGTYCCQAMADIRYSQVAKAAIQAFDSRSKVRFVGDQPDIPDNVFPLDDRLFRLTGVYPKVSMLKGMELEAALRKSVP